MATSRKNEWALILGASSGFGGATAVELARHGFHIFGVHLDRKATLPNAEKIMNDIKALGRQAVFFNINASDPEARQQALQTMQDEVKKSGPDSQIRVLLHSLAFGTLRRFAPDDVKEAVTKAQMDMTIEVMANSLVYWLQELVARKLMREGGRVYAMTSSGGHRVWPTYGPVSGAKAALESHCRQLAMELAPKKITVNAIQAGVTDTPALRKIPGNEAMVEHAKSVNPMGRLTTTEDVAKAIALLSHEENYWMTGNVIRVDGGEDIVG
ncbi:MAG TPA: SDR family oxidoreductase [bacterium]